MRADFSRLTFAERNHYRRVLMQQGRVEIDADGNEQIAIVDHIASTTTTDVVGQSGYPVTSLPSGAPSGGFALGLNAAGTDLTIAPGRMYVDGLLVENDAQDATLLSQPDMPGMTTTADFGVTESGVYVVYLDVWERLITALDNPLIRETALGGPDTSVRTQVVWQVKLAHSGPVPAAGSPMPTCASAGQPWLAGAASTGTLAASSAAAASDLPCILPPETGYQRLENQLYRVEIHEPGQDGTATFKWSRENGSVVVMITALPPGGGGSGTGFTVTVKGLSDDPTLGLRAGDWVELIDDQAELTVGHGTLYQVATTPTDGQNVTITVGTAAPQINLSLHPKLRRWDQGSAGTSQGITVTTTDPVPLEGGVQVQFSAGTYQAGDYWLIPARTATSVQQGYVEWPANGSGPTPEPPLGIHHHYAQLGLVEFTAPETFAGLGTATTPTDCRLPFLPLTDLMPAQSLSPCTIVPRPGIGWEQPILNYFANAAVTNGQPARLDAEICFPVGHFPVNNPLVISDAGHILISGAGRGTQLVAADAGGLESVMQFTNCLSVGVRDLYGETSQVSSARVGGSRNHINGTLAFSNCGEVSVENVWLRCGSALSRGAACITVSSDVAPDNTATGTGSARIRGCQLDVGEMQVGIQLVHQARATIEDNEIQVAPAITPTTLGFRLSDASYLAAARSYLISQTALTQAAQAAAAQAAGTAAPATATAPTAPTPQASPATPAAPEPAASPQPAEDISEATTQLLSAMPPAAQSGPAGEEPAVPTPPASGAAPSGDAPAEGTPSGGENPGESTHNPGEGQAEGTPAAEAVLAGGAPAGGAPKAGSGILAAPVVSLGRSPISVNVGNQTLHFTAGSALQTTWQTYLDANAPKTFATQADALRYLKQAASTILIDPAARAGLSGFGEILHTLTEHVPLAGRGIVIGGQAISDLRIAGNTLSGVILGISVAVSHRASAAEASAKQRTPDHMGTISILNNTIGCSANDVAVKNARFGIFVGNVNSLEIDNNRLTLTPAGIKTTPPADAIRIIGHLGLKAMIRRNYMTGFPIGIRAVPLIGNGPATRAPVFAGNNNAYLLATRQGGTQWLIADNTIENASTAPAIGPYWRTKKPTPTPQDPNPKDPNPAASPGPFIDAYSFLQINNVVPVIPPPIRFGGGSITHHQ
jgi:hypothetical protein